MVWCVLQLRLKHNKVDLSKARLSFPLQLEDEDVDDGGIVGDAMFSIDWSIDSSIDSKRGVLIRTTAYPHSSLLYKTKDQDSQIFFQSCCSEKITEFALAV